MQRKLASRLRTQFLPAALSLVFCAGAAEAADTYSGGVLTLSSLAIGSATYSNVVISPITLGDVVSFTPGGTPNGSVDTYNPGTARLTIPTITVGARTYTNVIVAIPSSVAVSIGSVSGADSYDGVNLQISQVQVGSVVYGNVVVGVGSIVRVAGGMPTATPDTYNTVVNQLAIPAVQVGSKVYTNVVITAGSLRSVGGISFRNQESILHVFEGNAVYGSQPEQGLVLGRDGNFYGTTTSGGAYNLGAVFKVTPGGVETVLHSFHGGTADGASPYAALIQGSDGNLYGTTEVGGTYNEGTAFRITPAGAETILYSFQAAGTSDGNQPYGALTQGSDGNFYGTTYSGGSANSGVVFKITPAGVETVLYSFQSTNTSDGYNPNGALVQGSDGNFYGTTQSDGAANYGTVFKITPAGVETVLHYFGVDPNDGNTPYGALIQGNDGNFYGTTDSGGTAGNGVVFKITPAGAETVLYSFQGGTVDGANPDSSLILGNDGSFYGTTSSGGTFGNGTVFKVTPAGAESVLYALGNGTADGTYPDSPLILGGDGNFYSTTSSGGALHSGTLFKVTPAGVETVLYSFGGGISDGNQPYGALIQGSDGNFYGTTSHGGTFNGGNFFRITPAGTETVLYYFGGTSADGHTPYGALIQGSDGNFYGTTYYGGAHNDHGTVFKITPAGVETVLYSFGNGTADGVYPYYSLTQGSDGNFYGVTEYGGAYGYGTAFRITPSGVETVLVSFGNGTADASRPTSALTLGSDGNFYGTTSLGGASNQGTAFKLTPAGVETVLYSFGKGTTDGNTPYGALTQGSDGNFYGTTFAGGTFKGGNFFRITPAGVETVLYSFGNGTTDAISPNGALTQGGDGNFYGTAASGGAYKAGVVFKLTPTGVETVLYSFGNGTSDGISPAGALIRASDGSLVGVTSSGGEFGDGSIFKVTYVTPTP